jgi:hypothetical protein
MQKLKFNTISYYRGKYTVFLDSDTRYYFSNKRKAQDFLTAQSQRNFMAFLFISEYLSDLSAFYNLYNLGDATDFEFKFKVTDVIAYLNNSIAWMTQHHAGENNQPFVMQKLKGCYSELSAAFTLIRDKAAERGDTILKRRCDLRIDIVKLYSQQLFNVRSEAAGSRAQMKVV